MKKISILIIILILAIGSALSSELADKCEVSGYVVDKYSGESLPYASVQIISQEDSTIQKSTLTDIEGKYVFEKIDAGKYFLLSSYMGYEELRITKDVQLKYEVVEFDLIPKSYVLSEIEVAAEKNYIERNSNATSINISKDASLISGTALDAMQTLPSVDVGDDGVVSYRGSSKLIILLNGEQSELVKNLDQISASQIEKIELINNPSSKYDAEGTSGIINIVLKSEVPKDNQTNMVLSVGYPETFGTQLGFTTIKNKSQFHYSAGFNHIMKSQTKEHWRNNYENPNALNYYQFDELLNNTTNVFINSSYNYNINKKHHVGLSIHSIKKLEFGDREIGYKTSDINDLSLLESNKAANFDRHNHSFEGDLHYTYKFKEPNHFLKTKLQYNYFRQGVDIFALYFPNISIDDSLKQRSNSIQENIGGNIKLDYSYPINDSILLETGYSYSIKNLYNSFDFYSWGDTTSFYNKFNYKQQINAVYMNLSAKLKVFNIQAGVRAEHTLDLHNVSKEYLDFFPSMYISHNYNSRNVFYSSYNRRINRPTIKMLSPYSDEYIDLLNIHIGNPELNPEYVNSYEIGHRFTQKKFSVSSALYFRDINQAISRVKSATNDSALTVTFINIEKASLLGSELAISYKVLDWWKIYASGNLFQTRLNATYGNNTVNKSRIACNGNITNSFMFPKGLTFKISAYYRSKLPSIMGVYAERYYMDFAVSKSIMNGSGKLVVKVSDVFNTYLFGLDLDAIDDNGFGYSQVNRRKIESRYFVLSFVLNVNSNSSNVVQKPKKQKDSYYLNSFDKK